VLAPKKNNVKRLILNSAPPTPTGFGKPKAGKSPSGKSPLSKSLNLNSSIDESNYISSRWLKSAATAGHGLVRQRTRLNLPTDISRDDSLALGEGGGGDSDVNNDESLLETRMVRNTSLSPFRPFTPRIRQIVDIPEEDVVGAGGASGAKETETHTDTNNTTPSPAQSGVRRSCGLISTRPGYFVHPPLSELDKMIDQAGNCIVTGFEVGRRNFGKIRYLHPVNVVDLNIDEIGKPLC